MRCESIASADAKSRRNSLEPSPYSHTTPNADALLRTFTDHLVERRSAHQQKTRLITDSKRIPAVAGEWFQMWQSTHWNGQEPAFRFYITVLVAAIFVGKDDPR